MEPGSLFLLSQLSIITWVESLQTTEVSVSQLTPMEMTRLFLVCMLLVRLDAALSMEPTDLELTAFLTWSSSDVLVLRPLLKTPSQVRLLDHSLTTPVRPQLLTLTSSDTPTEESTLQKS